MQLALPFASRTRISPSHHVLCLKERAMRWTWTHIALACILPSLSLAIKSSEVGVVDWHTPNIGTTLTGNPALLPTFHRIEEDGSTKSLVITATASNVLAALHPENGTLGTSHIIDVVY